MCRMGVLEAVPLSPRKNNLTQAPGVSNASSRIFQFPGPHCKWLNSGRPGWGICKHTVSVRWQRVSLPDLLSLCVILGMGSPFPGEHILFYLGQFIHENSYLEMRSESDTVIESQK